MTDDRLTPPGDDRDLVPAPFENGGPIGAPIPQSYYAPTGSDEEGSSTPKLGRYIAAVARRKWWVVAAGVVGMVAAFFAWTNTRVQYTARGNLWLEVETRSNAGDVSAIRQASLFSSPAWLELLKSFAVLDPVVVEERLYVEVPEDFEVALRDLAIDPFTGFVPGTYRLEVADDGRTYTLTTDGGVAIEAGAVGDSIGRPLGLQWSPEVGTLPPGEEIEFKIVPPRDASMDLLDELLTRMDEAGNFISLSIKGPDPVKAAQILNSVMNRHVELASELKRAKLEETLAILREQLIFTQDQLTSAERQLEEFRIETITLPTDESTPITPGLAATRDPVFANFFNTRIQLEQVRRDRVRLEQVLSESGEELSIEALEVIPEAASSTELDQVIAELVEARAGLRALRDRYEDEYPLVQQYLTRIQTLEEQAVPRVAGGIVAQLRAQERDLQMRLDSAGSELRAIPPRTIEEARLARQVMIQGNLYNELRGRVETARLAAASSIPDVRILDQATVPLVPTDDNRLLFAAMAFAGPLALAILLAILVDHLDPRLRYPGEISDDIGLQILGSIPRIYAGGGRRKAEENAAQVLEAFRELRVTLNFAYGAAGPVTLAVTSPAQGEGKSLISTNLAVAFAEMGRRTLLIDGDTRRGDAHRLLGLERAPGLTDYLRDRNGRDIIQSTQYEKLDFIGSGTRGTNTPELLASARMASFLGTLRRAYEVILVDCPPLAAGGDALILGGLTGNLALIVRTGATEKLLTLAKLEALGRLPIRILGAILNDVEADSRAYKYYSSYLPGYEANEEGELNELEGTQLLGTAEGVVPEDQ